MTSTTPAVDTTSTVRTLSIADPGPLGLAAFALTTFTLSVFNSGFLPLSLEPIVLPLALFYGGAAQVIAGIMEFFKNNTFGALAFTSYGSFWLAFSYILGHPELLAKASAADAPHAIGLFLLGWTIFTAYMLFAVTKVNGALLATFSVLLVAFICLTLGKFTGTTIWTTLGGYTGIITAFLAWYTSAAGVTNSTFGRVVFPVWPRK